MLGVDARVWVVSIITTLNIHYTLGVTTGIFGPMDVSVSIGFNPSNKCVITNRLPEFL